MPVVRTDVEPARALLMRAIANRIFPAAVAETGDSSGVLWREACGRLTFAADAPAAHDATVFDLASLTKPIATTTVVLQLASTGRLDLRDPVSACFDEWRGSDREGATIRDLLEHASGLAARLVDQPPRGRREFEHEICVMPLEYELRTQSVYSDLGFLLLGFLAEDRGGRSLSAQFDEITDRLAAADKGAVADESVEGSSFSSGVSGVEAFLAFSVPAERRRATAPTQPLPDDTRRGERLVGVVHDSYAAALGGVAGHAGLFGNAAGVGAFGRVLLRAARGDASLPSPFSPRVVARVARKSTVPNSSRSLGWDTMLPTSSCGSGMSPAAFGHVGYTGTSLWVDPILDRYFVLLTNRACDGGSLEEMRSVRRSFHDALVTLDA
jgi:CubicO group peptidase (beta-lactamase class C family)